MKRVVLGILLISLHSPDVFAAPPLSVPPSNVDAGMQLNRDRDVMKRFEIQRELEERKDLEEKALEDRREKEEPTEEMKGIKFSLKSVEFDESQILSSEELEAITEKYVGREVSVQELYDLVNEVNELYAQKGYLVCRAVLPEQSVEDGLIKVRLIEGKTGDVFFEGNESTRSGYLRGRLPLKSGEVSNVNELNRSLAWFNGTNSVQLQTEIRAGSQPGTSDYYIKAYEPKQHVFSLFADNAGFKSSGEWRGGLGYTNRSLLGFRDEFSINGLFSEGTTSGSVSYSFPITKRGTRLGFNYSANRTEIVDGPLEVLEIEGKSQSYGVTLTHPLVVSKSTQVELFGEWRNQSSQTEILGFDWVDDEITNFSGGVAVTHYGKDLAVYHRHSYGVGKWDDIVGDSKNYGKYNFMGIVQKGWKNQRSLTFRLNAQVTPDDFLPSADQFSIGGIYSVRGYKENFLSADGGVSASLEYGVPIKKLGQAFVFADFGTVFGENAFDDNTLYSAGIGFRWKFMKQGTATITLGIPFKKDYNGDNVSATQIHFAVSKQF